MTVLQETHVREEVWPVGNAWTVTYSGRWTVISFWLFCTYPPLPPASFWGYGPQVSGVMRIRIVRGTIYQVCNFQLWAFRTSLSTCKWKMIVDAWVRLSLEPVDRGPRVEHLAGLPFPLDPIYPSFPQRTELSALNPL